MLIPMIVALAVATPDRAFMRSGLIFSPMTLHSHGSCIVQCPNGDLLVCWYQGSGERSADDVRILGARMRAGSARWSAPFVMADTPGFPDCNPCMVVDPRKRLWLFWPTILDNHWESALMKYEVSARYESAGAPAWSQEKVLHLRPGPEFARMVERDLERQWAPYRTRAAGADRRKLDGYLRERHAMAQDKLKVRLGWMTRAHPFILDSKRLIVPLYSDGFDFSLMAMTDDWGKTWFTSEPLVGPGNVQPTLARRRDGTLVAFFRDNGPMPQRVMESESHDRGMTWSLAHDIDLPNPGSGLDVCVLKDRRWLLVYNDTEDGRNSLAASVSEDEGRTWRVTRHIEKDAPGTGAGSYSYPSVIQARDGTIWVSYSWNGNHEAHARLGAGESIKVSHFNEAWLYEGVR